MIQEDEKRDLSEMLYSDELRKERNGRLLEICANQRRKESLKVEHNNLSELIRNQVMNNNVEYLDALKKAITELWYQAIEFADTVAELQYRNKISELIDEINREKSVNHQSGPIRPAGAGTPSQSG